MTNKIIVSLVLALALALSGPAQAQELKIGVVNFQGLLQAAPQTKASMEALQEEFAPRERAVRAKTEEFEALQEKAQRDAAVMGEAELRNMQRDLRDGQRDLERLQQEFLEDSSLRRNEELGKLQRMLVEEIEAFATANSYDLILSEGVAFASGRTNITGQILAQLQAKAGN
ncbi:MAG: OmpH family outer membrane protein [Pseudomonadota bacterium]